MKPCRHCIYFYINSCAGSNAVVICLWTFISWMVECYTASRFIHLIGNINIWKVPKCYFNFTYIINNSEKNFRMSFCGCLVYQQTQSQHQLSLCYPEYFFWTYTNIRGCSRLFPIVDLMFYTLQNRKDAVTFDICGLWK